MSENVTFKEMAKSLGVEVTTVRRLVERYGAELGISIQKGRSSSSNSKWTHFLSREDADRLAGFYETRYGKVDATTSEDSLQRSGYFYVIQLVPEALPNRLKIGYTDNMDKRLTEHQTAAPTARLLASWPCKRSWDYAAMDSIARTDCALVLNEVFEGNPDGFLQRGNEFFAVMPKPDAPRVLSEHSPLKQAGDAQEQLP